MMFSPDVPQLPQEEGRWRNAYAALFLLCFFVIFGVLWHMRPTDSSLVFSNIMHPFSPRTAGSRGGDIIVAPPKPVGPALVGTLPDPSSFSAAAMLALDNTSGEVLFEKSPTGTRALASITKLMSALVILEKGDIDWSTTTTVIGGDALDTHMYAGDVHTLEELWQAALVGSSNKAILTLSQAIGWPEEAFVERMNQKAVEMGLSETRFVDSTGLSEQDVSSASDVVHLLKAVLLEEKIHTTLQQAELNLYSKERRAKHHLFSTNWLLLGWIQHDFATVVGKTGYTEAAGYNFAGQITAKDGRQIIVAVLGTNSHEARFTEARDLATAVFRAYEWSE